ncbi:MAG: nodulation protein NodH [Paracoccaceae bacterium]
MAFDYFVILAEMRTGSNLLESNLDAFDGIACHGELFNPGFINTAGTREYHGVTLEQRDADPFALLQAVRAAGPRMVGFRLFHNHDPRILAHVLADTGCAKIVLTRNPLESYVSRKIAAATNQWRLHNVKDRKAAQVEFDPIEFEDHVSTLQATQIQILNTLQKTGQSAFYVAYDDLNDLSVLNGMARWLGVHGQLDDLPRSVKKQNPEPLESKLTNPQALAAGLARLDRFDLGRTPNFEVRRGPMLDAWHGGKTVPLLFMPTRGAPEGEVIEWLAALDEVPREALPRDFDAGRLRDWRRAHPGSRGFTVLRHPLRRAHVAFERVLNAPIEPVREHMARLFAMPLPEPGTPLPPDEHQRAFKAFLRFAAASLSGQTGLQPWPIWASQAALVQGFSQSALPDMILREDQMIDGLALLARQVGRPECPTPRMAPHDPLLALILDDEIADLCQGAYQRDYDTFGFDRTP